MIFRKDHPPRPLSYRSALLIRPQSSTQHQSKYSSAAHPADNIFFAPREVSRTATFGLSLGPIVMGTINPLIDYRATFLCLAFICLIDLIYFQVYVRKARSVKQAWIPQPVLLLYLSVKVLWLRRKSAR
jgi:hypothetical protein